MPKETDYQWTLHDFHLYFNSGYCLLNSNGKKELVYIDGCMTETDLDQEEDDENYNSQEEQSSSTPVSYLVGRRLDNGRFQKPIEDFKFLKPDGISIETGAGAGFITKNNPTMNKYKKVFHPNEYSLTYPLSDKRYGLDVKHEPIINRHVLEVKADIPAFLINRRREFNKESFNLVEQGEKFGTIYNQNYWFHWFVNGLFLMFRTTAVGYLDTKAKVIHLGEPITIQQKRIAREVGYEPKAG